MELQLNTVKETNSEEFYDFIFIEIETTQSFHYASKSMHICICYSKTIVTAFSWQGVFWLTGTVEGFYEKKKKIDTMLLMSLKHNF